VRLIRREGYIQSVACSAETSRVFMATAKRYLGSPSVRKTRANTSTVSLNPPPPAPRSRWDFAGSLCLALH
jgi:hypothetical protein